MDLYRLPRRAHVLHQLTLALSPSGVSSTSMHAASAAATAANAASMSISMRASLLALCLHGRDQDPSDQASSCPPLMTRMSHMTFALRSLSVL